MYGHDITLAASPFQNNGQQIENDQIRLTSHLRKTSQVIITFHYQFFHFDFFFVLSVYNKFNNIFPRYYQKTVKRP